MSSRRTNLLQRLQRARPRRSYTQIRRSVPPFEPVYTPVVQQQQSQPSLPPGYANGYDSDYHGKQYRAQQKQKQKQKPQQQPQSKIEKTVAGAWRDIKEVISEPFVIVSLIAAMLVLFLSSETKINSIVTDFLKSHNIPDKFQQLVPRAMHYLFASAPLISLTGRRRWGAFATAGSICYVMLKQEYIAYAILGVAVRLIFQARSMQVGLMMLVAVFTVLAIYNASLTTNSSGGGSPGPGVNRNVNAGANGR